MAQNGPKGHQPVPTARPKTESISTPRGVSQCFWEKSCAGPSPRRRAGKNKQIWVKTDRYCPFFRRMKSKKVPFLALWGFCSLKYLGTFSQISRRPTPPKKISPRAQNEQGRPRGAPEHAPVSEIFQIIFVIKLGFLTPKRGPKGGPKRGIFHFAGAPRRPRLHR